ncbi:MAG: hypothetical protein FVQ85_04630 [Planctomycetes bacterium]|nr:hypothetical protein [Planctomycetota bacterium]
MNISAIIAKALGIILLLLWLFFLPAGRVCLRQMRGLLLWEPTDNLNEKLKLWLEKAGDFQKITVSIMHKTIIRKWDALSAGRDYIRQMGAPRCDKLDNFHNQIVYAMYTIIFRWHILPFIIGVGLILSGSLWLILVLAVAWILSVPPFFFIVEFLLVIVSGWVYGGLVYNRFYSGSGLWYYVSSGVGVLCMFLFCYVILAVTGTRKLYENAQKSFNKNME